MKSDVVIVGSELDAFVASIRLQEIGYSSRIISSGKGSYLYGLGSIKVFGTKKNKIDNLHTDPFNAIESLPNFHPYKKIGEKNVEESIRWFLEYMTNKQFNYSFKKNNSYTISPIGIKMPSYGLYYNQLNFEEIKDANISIVHFKNQRDFHSQLIAKSLKEHSQKIEIVFVDPPDKNQHLDNSSLALSFDRLSNVDAYFKKIKEKLSKDSSAVIFPAVLGVSKYRKIINRIREILSKECYEAPTLPPSIPGIRLNKVLEREVLKFNSIHRGSHAVKANIQGNNCTSIVDNFGRTIEGKAFIFSNGGILMGGLSVNTDGSIVEKIFNSKINQINPMACEKSYESLNALQSSGILTDEKLKPLRDGHECLSNVYFTGRNLSHWNPSSELSSEGISIASGWYCANNIASILN